MSLIRWWRKYRKKYTPKDLEEFHKKYERNYNNLIASIGTRKHAKFACKEKKLNLLEIRIRQGLGGKYREAIKNYCPIVRQRDCSGCTGYYNFKKQATKAGITFNKNFMCNQTDEGATKCGFHVKMENIERLTK